MNGKKEQKNIRRNKTKKIQVKVKSFMLLHNQWVVEWQAIAATKKPAAVRFELVWIEHKIVFALRHQKEKKKNGKN